MTPPALRVLWICRCGVTRAFDYADGPAVRVARGGRFAVVTRYRRDATGAVRDSRSDGACTCGQAARRVVVHGRVTTHPCGGDCRSAQSRTCACECGGANHGRDYQLGHETLRTKDTTMKAFPA